MAQHGIHPKSSSHLNQLKHLLSRHWFPILLALYALISLLWLTRFPFVHSDESWLSGLTRQMMTQRSFQVTEPFFDLYPRNPHAIKLLFHLLQMPWILTLGYGIFSVRLMSLTFGLLSLITFRKVLLRMGIPQNKASLGTLLLASTSQFIYASHTARQEIVVFFFMLAAFERLLAGRVKTGAALSAAGLWLHPNGFIAAAILFFIMLLLQRKSLPVFILTHTLSLFLIIAASLALDPHFFTHYLSYGDTLEVTADTASRLQNFRDFYLKLYHRVSATYYNADIRPWLMALPVLMISAALTWRQKTSSTGLTALLVLNTALFAIGRFNPTSILFAWPWIILIFLGHLEPTASRNQSSPPFQKIPGKLPGIQPQTALLTVLIALSALSASQEMLLTEKDNYTHYLEQIRSAIPPGSKVLGNLNVEFAFAPGELIDIRNLDFLDENQLSLEEYLKTRGIQYVILTDELDYIARNPKWNILYGDISKWYPKLQVILKKRGTEMLRFRDDTYSVRIARYIHTPEWTTTVYKLN